jgi:hypothetical protein
MPNGGNLVSTQATFERWNGRLYEVSPELQLGLFYC